MLNDPGSHGLASIHLGHGRTQGHHHCDWNPHLASVVGEAKCMVSSARRHNSLVANVDTPAFGTLKQFFEDVASSPLLESSRVLLVLLFQIKLSARRAGQILLKYAVRHQRVVLEPPLGCENVAERRRVLLPCVSTQPRTPLVHLLTSEPALESQSKVALLPLPRRLLPPLKAIFGQGHAKHRPSAAAARLPCAENGAPWTLRLGSTTASTWAL
mmetsp:Transcript_11508/g.28666  ORF Transcript_11508/g.28666 Transcript_11508/m.28666 type:complete len:214 (-) Transcript_11508:142-783(-)